MSRWNEAQHPRRPDGKFGTGGGWLGRVEQSLPAPRLLEPNRPGEKFNPKAGLTPEQSKRMKKWRRDALRPAGVQVTRREARIERLRLDVAMARKRIGEVAVDVRQENRSMGWSNDQMERFIESTRKARQGTIDKMEDELRRLSDPTYDPDGFIDTPDYTRPGGRWRLANKPDPKRPLAVYGDMMHIGGAAGSYRHVEELEKIPVRFHAVVAQHMLEGRDPSRGIWVSTQPVPYIDSNQDLADVEPRGWGSDKTWKDVDGAHRPGRRQLIAGHSPNADAHGHSAVIHEFGHALDHALGDASAKPEWLAVYRPAVENARVGFNPYFKQSGKAGPQELWGEAFSAWTRSVADAPDSDPDWHAALVSSRLRVSHEDAVAIIGYFNGLKLPGGVQ